MNNLGSRSQGRCSHPHQWEQQPVVRRLSGVTTLSLMLLTFVALTFSAVAQDTRTEPEVRTTPWVGDPVKPYIIETDLRTLPIRPIWQPGDAIKEVPRLRRTPDLVNPKPAGQIDPLLRNQTIVDGTVPVNAAFPDTDINMDGQGFAGVNPPDTVGDVGLNYYIQAINGAGGATFTVYDKTDGTLVAGPFTLDSFGTGGCGAGLGDPIVLYDQEANRWMISEFASGANILCVYVSRTDDPIAGGWNAYAFPTPSFPDYPKYGIMGDAYYVGTNEADTALYALDRNAMLAGETATAQRFTIPDLGGFGFQMITPADHDGATAPPANAPGIFMRHRDDEVHNTGGDTSADFLEIFEFNVDFDTPANSALVGPFSIPVTEFDSSLCGLTSFSCFPQPGSSVRLDPLREVVMYRLQYRNFGPYEVLVGNFVVDVDGNDRGGIRWFELRKSGDQPWELFQEGTYSPDSDNRFMAAISMDGNGNIALAYNVSSTTQAPSLRYTGRLATDPLGTMPQGEHSIVEGTTANASNRYGDYSALNVDPSTDCSFWFTGEYNAASTWSTRIANFGFDECRACDNPPADPTNLTVANEGDNRIALTWDEVPGATSYRVYRAQAACPTSRFQFLAGDITRNAFVDTDVSGGLTYAYVVRAFGDCESGNSNCADVTATGSCRIPPEFAGLQSVDVTNEEICSLSLTWEEARPSCGQGVSYAVYRSTVEDFTPSRANLIASCVNETRYLDADIDSGVTYYYIVRAEDDTTDGNGPCNGGNRDDNTVRVSGLAVGPEIVVFSDDFTAGLDNWSTVPGDGDGGGTERWEISTVNSNSAPNALFASDEPDTKDQTAALVEAVMLPAGLPAKMTFFQNYQMESGFDGGVLEYSVDGGANWFDILAGNGDGIPANANRFVSNGYNDDISTFFGNPLGGRDAWTGRSDGFIQTEVDLSDFAGQALQIRFRIGCDTSISAPGWWVDDVVIASVEPCYSEPCSYELSADSTEFTRDGGRARVEVTTNRENCEWTPVSDSDWLTILGDDEATGNGMFGVEAAPNTLPDARTATVTVADQTITFTQERGNQAPEASFTIDIDEVTVNLTDTSVDPDGEIVERLWDFGNGDTSTEANPSYFYRHPGTYTITLTVTDNLGDSDSVSETVELELTGPPFILNGETIDGLNADTFEWIYYRLIVPENAVDLNISIDGGTGDADLYTRFGAAPTKFDFNCRPMKTGNTESCFIAQPEAGVYYIGLWAYSDFDDVSLSVSFLVNEGGVGFTETDLSADKDEWLYFTIEVPEGRGRLELAMSGGTGDGDLYVRYGAEPNKDEFDQRGYLKGNNESIRVTNPRAGTYHIGIRAYQAFEGVTLEAYHYNP